MFMSVHKGEGGVKIVPNPVHVVCERPLGSMPILTGKLWPGITWRFGYDTCLIIYLLPSSLDFSLLIQRYLAYLRISVGGIQTIWFMNIYEYRVWKYFPNAL